MEKANHYIAKITDINMPEAVEKGGTLSFSANVALTADEQANVYVSLWKDGLLYGVVETHTAAANGRIECSGDNDKPFPAGNHTA